MQPIHYVNPFHGNGSIDLPKAEGIAASWHFIKALCGNTHPGATLPFGKYSVMPYSGGYSAGYGTNRLNCGEPIQPLMDTLRLIGFSHFQHSGTGAIGMYYNYAVVTPYIGDKLPSYAVEGEFAHPGYYAVTLGESGIHCELTVSETAAYHRYTFPEAGAIAVDFTNDGLYDIPQLRGEAVDCVVTIHDPATLTASVTLRGVRLYFVVRYHGDGALDADGVYHTAGAGVVTLTVTMRADSADAAMDEALRSSADFDAARRHAIDTWSDTLGRIHVDSDEDDNELAIFYSNLYHSLVKPCDWGDGGFLWDGAPFVIDFATMWDVYKTTLPLIYTLYPTMSAHIVAMYMRLGETLGQLPHCFLLTNDLNIENRQARLNAVHTLYDAWVRGIPADWERVWQTIRMDIARPDFRDFFDGAVCARNTHTLDMAEGCRAASLLARALGHDADADALAQHAEKWVNAFDPATGLLHAKSDYYEGNHWNYSFRPMADMNGRIALAGGATRFEALLDSFFGFTNPDDKSGRFEGFNNETDMEAPYAYAYIGRHDKLAAIVHSADQYMFRTAAGTTGRGGIPGNNDSGGLSSCYIWNALGIFPVSGQDKILLGCPKFGEVTLSLSSGTSLTIRRIGADSYPVSAIFNGVPCKALTLTAAEMMQGGTLEITMA